MRKYLRWVVGGVVLLGLAALLVWVYSYSSPMTPRASEGWSRGRVVGRTPVSRAVALRSAPDQGVLLVWPDLEGGLELAHIGANGSVLTDRLLSVEAEEARDPQLQVAADGRLHLLWRDEGGAPATLRYALLESDGTPVGPTRTLSDSAHSVSDAPRLLLDAHDRLHVLWADALGIHWAVMNAEGTLIREPVLLVAQGRSPAAQVDGQGMLHLAWQQPVGASTHGVYYAALDPESARLSDPEEITLVFLRTAQRIEGPAVGLGPETGYVLWAVQDLREVSSQGRYAFFPLELPRQKRVSVLWLERGSDPSGMYPLEKQQEPLLVALSETVPTPQGRADPQVALVALVRDQTPEYEVWGLGQHPNRSRSGLALQISTPEQMGVLVEELPALGREREEVVTASTRPAIKPVLVMDRDSRLHMAWLEPGGFGRYRVVYASTSPSVMRAYNALTLWDVVDAVLTRLLRLSVVVLAVVPMAVLWALFPLTGLLIYHLVTGEEGLDTSRSRVVLGAMLVLEVALTLVFPPRLDMAWPLLRWVAPLATAAVAVVVTLSALRRRWDSILFGWFFVFTGVHGLLQLLLYFLL